MHADAESRISSSIFFALDCDSYPRVELFSFKIFQTLLKNFALVCRGSNRVTSLGCPRTFSFSGRFLIVESGSRFSGHPVSGKLVLIVLHPTSPARKTLVRFFGPRTDFKVSGRFPAVRPKFSIIGSPKTFP